MVDYLSGKIKVHFESGRSVSLTPKEISELFTSLFSNWEFEEHYDDYKVLAGLKEEIREDLGGEVRALEGEIDDLKDEIRNLREDLDFEKDINETASLKIVQQDEKINELKSTMDKTNLEQYDKGFNAGSVIGFDEGYALNERKVKK